MPLWPLLLRVVLSLTLLMNGVTTAMASVQMDIHHASQMAQAARLTPVANAHQSCHEGAAEPDGKATKDEPPPGDHSRHSDCCKSASCRCACLQSAQATVPMWSAVKVPAYQFHSVRPLPLGHAEPRLPHLIRPPIG